MVVQALINSMCVEDFEAVEDSDDFDDVQQFDHFVLIIKNESDW